MCGYIPNWAKEIFVRIFKIRLPARHPLANAQDIEMQVQFLGREDPLEKGMATHSSILV